MSADYIIPLGVDGKKIMSGFDEIITGVDNLGTKSKEVGKDMEDALRKGAKAGDELEKSLKPTGKLIDVITSGAREAGKNLNNAFDIKATASSFNKQVQDFKDKLDDVTTKRKIGLEVDATSLDNLTAGTDYLKQNFDEISGSFKAAISVLDGNIDQLNSQIAETEANAKDLAAALETIAPGQQQQELFQEFAAMEQALKEDKAALADYQNQVEQMEDANKNLADTLKTATKAVDDLKKSQAEPVPGGDLGEGAETAAPKFTSLRTQIRNVREELSALEMAGQTNTARFRELSQQAGELQDQMGDTAAQISTLASDTKYIDATISGVTGLVGAFTLAQGAIGLFGAENEELQKILLKVNSAMAVLQGLQAVADTLNKDSAFSVIFLRNARAADTAATTAQTTAIGAQTVATNTATFASKAFSLALKGMGIGLVIGLVAYLVENWDKLTGAFQKILPAGKSVGSMFDSIKSIGMGVGNVLLQYLITPFRALTALLSGNLDEFKSVIVKGLSFKQNFQAGFDKQETANAKAHARELEAVAIESAARDLARRKARGEDVAAQEIALQKRRVANAEAGSKAEEENIVALQDLQDANYKQQKDAQEKAAEDAKKKREEAAKKRLELEEKTNAQVVQYTRALADSRINAISNEAERERAKINEEYKRKREDMEKDGALSAETRKAQGELFRIMEEERAAKIAAVDKKEFEDRAELQLAAQKTFAELQKEGTARSLELLSIDHEERKAQIEKDYKDEADVRAKLIGALERSTAEERKKIMAEGAKKALDDEEERQLLTIDLMSKYSKKSEETERQKQIAILSTQIEFKQKYLDSIVSGGAGANSLEVLRAQKELKDLRNGLQDEIKKGNGKGFDFFEFIGLGSLDDDQRGMVQKAAGQVLEGLGNITDFIVDQYQRQIDKKQESIDQLEDAISDLEGTLDEEKSLRDAGFANNVEVIEAELAAKQRQKDEEVKQQEELVKKQQAIQRAQMAVDTAVQLVNMVTSSTQIFKAFSGIPFIGVPLAIAAIGAMFGAFTVAKIKAAQAINDGGKKYKYGGYISDGGSHEQGGKKYYSPAGDVAELEQGEYVINKKSVKKYKNIVEAINTDTFSAFDINDTGLKYMLSQMGISMADEETMQAVQESRKLDSINVAVTVAPGTDMKELNENIRFLAQAERERITSWEDDKYMYVKRGSTINKFLRNPIKQTENADS